eukprot:CAMPEP_0114643760 /NCGR_PEP_ID=MMETSP0191-20121206/3582_1 /TAXON_ID=126664 /ORGANISM="Sorites sp." /LENGTH=188 /DNA_ID=CAMNT_0001856129 /DNA_START=516 /DNA_END=1082 /DNA_ORIENTATION=+
MQLDEQASEYAREGDALKEKAKALGAAAHNVRAALSDGSTRDDDSASSAGISVQDSITQTNVLFKQAREKEKEATADALIEAANIYTRIGEIYSDIGYLDGLDRIDHRIKELLKKAHQSNHYIMDHTYLTKFEYEKYCEGIQPIDGQDYIEIKENEIKAHVVGCNFGEIQTMKMRCKAFGFNTGLDIN